MSKLPSELPPRLANVPNYVSAYSFCLTLEDDLLQEAIDTRTDARKDVGRRLIYCRITGYLLIYGPSDRARTTVSKEIVSCNREDDPKAALLQLGQMYYEHYLRAFRSNKGRIPTPSRHASRPSFDTLAAMIKDMMKEAPQDHATAKKQALVRDGFRCAITRIPDIDTALINREFAELVTREKVRPQATQCSHIISESINFEIPKGSNKEQYAASVWTILQRFGYDRLPEELNGSNIHRLDNVITMEHTIHKLFDALQIWFSPTNTPNAYKIEARNAVSLYGIPEYVTFTTTNQEKLPVPNPTYIALHAACARVAHLSGAAEYIDDVFRRTDETMVLSTDGTAADILEHALLYASPRGIEV